MCHFSESHKNMADSKWTPVGPLSPPVCSTAVTQQEDMLESCVSSADYQYGLGSQRLRACRQFAAEKMQRQQLIYCSAFPLYYLYLILYSERGTFTSLLEHFSVL